jgi:hypothetical protein
MSGVAKAKLKPAADVPTDFGRHLRACMRCKLLKTFEQVRCAHRAGRAALRPDGWRQACSARSGWRSRHAGAAAAPCARMCVAR